MDIYFQLHLHFAGLGWLAAAAAVVSILSWVGVTPQSLLHRFGLFPKPPAVVYERLPSPLTQYLVIVLPHRSPGVCVVHPGGLHGSFARTQPTRRACEDSLLSSAWRRACAFWGGRPRRAVWRRRRGCADQDAAAGRGNRGDAETTRPDATRGSVLGTGAKCDKTVPRRPRAIPARALSEPERQAVLAELHSGRFVDCSPAQVWAKRIVVVNWPELRIPRRCSSSGPGLSMQRRNTTTSSRNGLVCTEQASHGPHSHSARTARTA